MCQVKTKCNDGKCVENSANSGVTYRINQKNGNRFSCSYDTLSCEIASSTYTNENGVEFKTPGLKCSLIGKDRVPECKAHAGGIMVPVTCSNFACLHLGYDDGLPVITLMA